MPSALSYNLRSTTSSHTAGTGFKRVMDTGSGTVTAYVMTMTAASGYTGWGTPVGVPNKGLWAGPFQAIVDVSAIGANVSLNNGSYFGRMSEDGTVFTEATSDSTGAGTWDSTTGTGLHSFSDSTWAPTGTDTTDRAVFTLQASTSNTMMDNTLTIDVDDGSSDVSFYWLAPTHLDLVGYRFRNDDGNEASATWAAAQNTAWSAPTGTKFRLRVEIDNDTGEVAESTTVYWQYRVNSGSWNYIGDTSGDVRRAASTNVNGVGTTNQLTAGSGTFVSGWLTELSDSTDTFCLWSSTPGQHTEHEIVAELRTDGSLANGDVIEFRMVKAGTVLFNAYTVTPTLTVGTGAIELTPTPVVASLALVAPSLTYSAVDLAPAAVSAASAVTAPTLASVLDLAPAAVSAVSAVTAPALTTGAVDLAPAAVSVASAVTAPALTTGAVDLAPAAVASSVAVPAPTIDVAALNLAPAPVVTSLAVVAPTIGIGAVTLSPAAVSVAGAVPAPTVEVQDGTIELAPASVSTVLSVSAPALALSLELAPAAVIAITATVIPSLGLSLELAPVSVAANSATTVPALSLILDLAPASVGALLSVPLPDVDAGNIALSPAPVAASLGVVAPSLQTVLELVPAAVASSLVVPVPSVSGDAVSLAPIPVVATLVAPAPLVEYLLELAPASVGLGTAVAVPTLGTGAVTLAPAAVAVTPTLVAPTLGYTLDLSPAAVSALLGVPLPALAVDSTLWLAPDAVVAALSVPDLAARVGPFISGSNLTFVDECIAFFAMYDTLTTEGQRAAALRTWLLSHGGRVRRIDPVRNITEIAGGVYPVRVE